MVALRCHIVGTDAGPIDPPAKPPHAHTSMPYDSATQALGVPLSIMIVVLVCWKPHRKTWKATVLHGRCGRLLRLTQTPRRLPNLVTLQACTQTSA